MFKENKYTKLYYTIINRALTRSIDGYKERHHIIPKCLGGSNDLDNLVELTAREHFICHLLLIKMVEGNVKHKIVYAAWQQSRPSKYKEVKVTSRIYEMLRKQMSESYTGRKRAPFSDQARANMKAAAKHRKKVPVTQERIENIRKGVAKRKKLIGEENPFYGKTHSTEFLKKQSIRAIERFTNVPKTRVSCIHCKKEITVNILPRFHGDRCKSIKQ